MSTWRVSPEQERWLSLASRFRDQRKAPLFIERIGGWRSANLITRCAFFMLGMMVAGTTLSICNLLHLGNGAFVAGVLLIVAAEWLVISRRIVFSGIEEALELGGLLMLAFQVWDWVDPRSEVFIALLAAVVFGLAGLRLLNPLFTTLAAVLLSAVCELSLDKPGMDPRNAPIWAGLLCFAIAWLALGLGATQFRRPSHERMLSWLMVLMPLAGYLWMASSHRFASLDSLRDQPFSVLLAPILPLVFGVTALLIGVQRRSHAALAACMICIACVAFEFRRLTGLSLEARLILWGCAALAAAISADRALRKPRAGITSQRLHDDEGALNILELAGAAVITPRSVPADARLEPGEGRFGGGGASGRY